MEALFNKVWLPIAAGVVKFDKFPGGVAVIHESGTIYRFTLDEIHIIWTWFRNSEDPLLRKFVYDLTGTKTGQL